jgi:ABC-2 type transport system ATP-binding protein
VNDERRPILAARSLVKEFGGKRVLSGVSFDLFPGEIVGLLGPNGAGKTTTLRLLVDLLRPDEGTLDFAGATADRGAMDRIGYLPEERGLYKRLTAVRAVCYFAALKGVPRPVAESRAEALLTELGLGGHLTAKCEELSKGMQQKVQLVGALIHDPEVVLLDEPFTGLDPVSTQQVREQIRRLREAGKSVLLSTHLMSEAETLCDRVLMINRGELVLEGAVQALKQRLADDRAWTVECDTDLTACPLVQSAERTRNGRLQVVTLNPDVPSADLLRWLADHRVEVQAVAKQVPSLEEVFLRAVSS